MPRESYRDLEPGQRRGIGRGLFVYRQHDGSLWYGISYVVNGRRVRECKWTTKKGASDAREDRKTDKRRGVLETPKKKPKVPMVAEYCDMYLEKYAKPRKKSWDKDRLALRRFVDFLGNRRLDEVSTFDIQRFQAEQQEGKSKAGTNRDIAIVKRALALAVEWGHIPTNPAKPVKQYKEEEQAIRAITKAEQAKLIAACDDDFRPVVIAALNTGMRRGELFNLDWERANLERDVITVENTKSGRVRHIPINSTLRATLEGLPEPRTGHVFKRKDGRRWHWSHKEWNRARKRAGIEYTVTLPDGKNGKPRTRTGPRFHDLRHTFGTELVLAGVDLVTVKELLGHENIQTTMRYLHASPESKRQAVERLSQSGQEVATTVVEIDFKKR